MTSALASLLLLAQLHRNSTTPFSDFDSSQLLELHPIPAKYQEMLMPSVEAKAALLVDVPTGLILYEKNANQALPMASLTKIMTAVLILENHLPQKEILIQKAFGEVEGVKIWLREGDQITVKGLLQALLIPSAGDAAMVLAQHHSGSIEAFVEQMNLRAIDLGLHKTHFLNPIGLDEPDHQASAADLASLSRYALRFALFRDIVASSSALVVSSSGKEYSLNSTNALLGSYLDIKGVKTGTTDEAGQSLIVLAEGPQGQQVLAVLLNSPARFQEAKSMIDWSFRAYQW